MRLQSLKMGKTILTLLTFANPPSEFMSDQVQPVADAEHRDSLHQNRGVDAWTVRLKDARRPAGNNDALAITKLTGGRVAGLHLGVHAEIPHFARDQMAVLPPSVQDRDLRLRMRRALPMLHSGRPWPAILSTTSLFDLFNSSLACGM